MTGVNRECTVQDTRRYCKQGDCQSRADSRFTGTESYAEIVIFKEHFHITIVFSIAIPNSLHEIVHTFNTSDRQVVVHFIGGLFGSCFVPFVFHIGRHQRQRSIAIPIQLDLCQDGYTHNFQQFITAIDHAIPQGDTTRVSYKSGIVHKGCHT